MSPQNKAETMTHAGRLLWLAERELLCSCSGRGEVQAEFDSARYAECSQCKGTGKVSRFPTLRQKCKGSVSYFAGTVPPLADGSVIYAHQSTGCSACQDRGWTPANGLEVLLEVAARYRPGFILCFILWPHFGDDNYMTWVAQYQGTDFCSDNCRTPGEAVVLVLYRAVKGKGE